MKNLPKILTGTGSERTLDQWYQYTILPKLSQVLKTFKSELVVDIEPNEDDKQVKLIDILNGIVRN